MFGLFRCRKKKKKEKKRPKYGEFRIRRVTELGVIAEVFERDGSRDRWLVISRNADDTIHYSGAVKFQDRYIMKSEEEAGAAVNKYYAINYGNRETLWTSR